MTRTEKLKNVVLTTGLSLCSLVSIGSMLDIFAICAVVCLLAIFYCIYLLNELDKKVSTSSSSQMYNEIYQHIEELQKIIEQTALGIKKCESQLDGAFIQNSKNKVGALASLRKLLTAVRDRREEIILLINSSKNKNLVSARQLMKTPIETKDDAVDGLIGSEQLPAMDAQSLKSFISETLRQIEHDLVNSKKIVVQARH